MNQRPHGALALTNCAKTGFLFQFWNFPCFETIFVLGLEYGHALAAARVAPQIARNGEKAIEQGMNNETLNHHGCGRCDGIGCTSRRASYRE